MADIVFKVKHSNRVSAGPLKGAWYKGDEHRKDDTPELRQYLKDNTKHFEEVPGKSRKKQTTGGESQ